VEDVSQLASVDQAGLEGLYSRIAALGYEKLDAMTAEVAAYRASCGPDFSCDS
jgi:hypothetical protein